MCYGQRAVCVHLGIAPCVVCILKNINDVCFCSFGKDYMQFMGRHQD